MKGADSTAPGRTLPDSHLWMYLIVYPVTSTAPLFTLLFTALMLRNTERLTWRIVAGAVAITAGVIVL